MLLMHMLFHECNLVVSICTELSRNVYPKGQGTLQQVLLEVLMMHVALILLQS